MWSRLKNFGKRHKKKLIATGVLAAGVYCARRFVVPWLQDRLAKKIEEALREELAAKPSAKGQTRERFKHLLRVSDKHALMPLDQVRDRHQACFTIEALQASLADAQAKTKEERLEALQALGIECVARLISSIYTLHMLLLLQRVQFNIVGRELAKSASTEPSSTPVDGTTDSEDVLQVHSRFIEASKYLEEHGLSRIAASARASAVKVMEQLGYSPASKVTSGTLEELLLGVCTEADKDLLSDPDNSSSFLPASLDPEDPEQNAKIKPFLDEARDYLESPQFRGVLAAVSVSAVRVITGWLCDDSPDQATAPLADGRSLPLARLNGNFIELSRMVLTPDSELSLVEHFSAEPLVTQLCEGLYFQSGAESELASCPQQ